jgi:hypothetical protein
MENNLYTTTLNSLEKLTVKERVKILDAIYTMENLHGFVYYCETCEESKQGNLYDPFYCSKCMDAFCEDCVAGDCYEEKETLGPIITCEDCDTNFCRNCAKDEMTNDFKCDKCEKKKDK